MIQNQKTFGFTGGGEVEAAVGALYKGTPGIYGALFDTAIATATETMATLRTSASSYQPMASYTDNVRLVYSSKNQLAAALHIEPKRHATKPSRAAKKRRVDDKRRHSDIKRYRRRPSGEE